MLTGRSPFGTDPTKESLFYQIENIEVQIPSSISPVATDLIKKVKKKCFYIYFLVIDKKPYFKTGVRLK